MFMKLRLAREPLRNARQRGELLRARRRKHEGEAAEPRTESNQRCKCP